MVIRYCNHCNITYEDLYDSKCPKCGQKTKGVSKIYFCPICNVPIYYERCELCGSKGFLISTDVRPVFPEERFLMETLLEDPFAFKGASVWADLGGSRYFVNGEKITFNKKSLYKSLTNEKIKKIQEYLKQDKAKEYEQFEEMKERFIEANRYHLDYITNEAQNFIKEAIQGYSQDEIFVSFSGGKDSTVVSNLVIRAVGSSRIIHIFGDTTLEFPFTIEYINRFKIN
uniref:phosphoadenosine phosphosulfate reductase domain-containing protein n=1 Tax=Caldicellulosiruptor sp. F32 TaxID=1214564 RepID=UPI00058437B6